ncbi:N-acyl-phosphatidylethanolamine-hydrolyzing phospholipase D [Zopfia rhizophila CBS 207.26]|uniref:N-acyl-phosphatidylethanolamine-hydrolyzing phospholipase D n=1 Tax=Zopfia rhizophila CBS 207.26 TaxID=1314779 RepID=A0A6A6EHY6_9PEZI|nr:N-acyl-phosphatidylethanolamine-hydrolyzing phospholipase D [Zopfia rhizophila CBS 207.26]
MSSAGGIGSAALYAVVTGPGQIGAQPEDAGEKKHHLKGGKGFRNPWDSFQEPSALKIIVSLLWRRISGQANKPDTTPPTVPIHEPTFLPSRHTEKLRATWLGHACYYVEFPGGFRVLFDPVFEDCCAPINISALKRYTPPPCEIEDLPAIDAVVISHNHYDHLSYPTIMRIHKKFPNANFFAPLGNKKWFLDSGIHNVTELDWWESRDVKLELVKRKDEEGSKISVTERGDNKTNPETITATIGALPCQHVSARGPFDRCKTLWASWSVESGGSKVYFAGDTGYRTVPKLPKGTDDYSTTYSHLPICPAFAEIGKHRGPFDLGLIPIGAYEPRFIMSPMHANPKDSVNIFVDTKCRKALGMHWGTWVLTEEDVLEPPRLLKQSLKEKDINEEGTFDVVDIGESREYDW